MFIYASHIDGSMYTSKTEISEEDLECELCGDSDTYIGEYKDWADFISQMDKATFDFHCFNLDWLSDDTGLTREKIIELNPNIKVWNKEAYGE